MKMNIKILATFVGFGLVGVSQALTLASWNFNDSNLSVDTLATGVQSGSLTETFDDPEVWTTGTTVNAEPATGAGNALRYDWYLGRNTLTFGIKAATGYTLDLDMFSVALRGSPSIVRMSLSETGGDGTFLNWASFTPTRSYSTFSAALPNGIFFTDYFVRSTFTGGLSVEMDIDNAKFTGDAVPEPATMALLGLGAAAMIRRRKSA